MPLLDDSYDLNGKLFNVATFAQPRVYSNVCVEMDVDVLAVTTLLLSPQVLKAPASVPHLMCLKR